jgi:hypothetical protein
MLNWEYDHEDNDITTFAQSCRYLKARAGTKSNEVRHEGVSCRICLHWDGESCLLKVNETLELKQRID